jgi:predicted dithiol-disulfide oxidoreductase (DUF899 family)
MIWPERQHYLEVAMSLPQIVSRDEWVVARKRLLVREKEETRARDALNADRRRLPMVRVEAEYVFEGPTGLVGLLELFGDSRQLLVYHAMFDPSWEQPCPGCAAGMAETAPGLFTHLKARDTSYVMVSRAPYPKLAECQEVRGWTFPWYSSYGSSFNYDFQVTLDDAVAPVMYNYRTRAELAEALPDWKIEGSTEMPGFSCFLRVENSIFHTYSSYGRGTEAHGSAYSLLDMTALGRQEDWEEPKGRVEKAGPPDPSFS